MKLLILQSVLLYNYSNMIRLPSSLYSSFIYFKILSCQVFLICFNTLFIPSSPHYTRTNKIESWALLRALWPFLPWTATSRNQSEMYVLTMVNPIILDILRCFSIFMDSLKSLKNYSPFLIQKFTSLKFMLIL